MIIHIRFTNIVRYEHEVAYTTGPYESLQYFARIFVIHTLGSFPNLISTCVANIDPLRVISASRPRNGTFAVSLFVIGFLSHQSSWRTILPSSRYNLISDTMFIFLPKKL
ncbi:hypothetical protein V8G54_030175 [Vigna mungo]|uniref:Uncharacterized protein n=1 Tax=Vigna mungo TaxID=3915 RepID=A0AAQ3MWJ9_VIGMU